MIETGSRAFSTYRDRELIEKRSELFEELMAYQKKVFLICLGFSRNASDAQDLAQDIYLKAYKNIHTLSELSLAKVWLFRIARNTCLNFQKKHRLDRISAIEITQKMKDPQTPESKMILQEQILLLKGAIHKLPKKQRDVFVLKEYGDLSYQEISETLKIELGTVMSRLNRARQAIKEKIKGEKNV
ncbi:MAG: sigma-70 family RNA polymerase sigma factor [Candidatus Aminicenantes bacterium]|nr:MAG: sigma-70 family RNA polymerase sigma factor [Candidatus Aminicenantes bacterium]